MPQKHFVWDMAVRLFHWFLVTAFIANVAFTQPGKFTHRYIGYAVAILIVLRLVWGLVGTKHARFTDFAPSLGAASGQIREIVTGRTKRHLGHSPLGALMIYNMLLTMSGIALTGYMMTTLAYFGIDWVATAHELLVTWAEVCSLVHVLAVVFESVRLRVNLPLSMVTGIKTFQDDL